MSGSTTTKVKKSKYHAFYSKKTLPFIAKAKIMDEEPELFKVMGDMVGEIYNLIGEACDRYKKTEECKRIMNPSKYDEVTFFKKKMAIEKDFDQYQRELAIAKAAAAPKDAYWKVPVRRDPNEENTSFGGGLHHKIHGVEYNVFTRTYEPELQGGFTWFLMRALKKEFSTENGIFLAHISNLTTQTTMERVEAYYQRIYIGMIRPGSGKEINVSSSNRKLAFAAYARIVAKYTLLLDVPYNRQGHVHEVVGGKSKVQDDGIHVDSKRGKKFDRDRAMTLDQSEIPWVDDKYIESLGAMPESLPPKLDGDVSGMMKSVPKKPLKKKKDTTLTKKAKSKSKLIVENQID